MFWPQLSPILGKASQLGSPLLHRSRTSNLHTAEKKKRLLQARLELNTPTTPNPKTEPIATAEASVRQNLVLRRESLTLNVPTCKKSNLAEDCDVLYRVVLGFVSLRLSGRVNCLVVLFALG